MKFRKGAEDLIFVAVLFGLAITLTFVMYIITSGNNNVAEQRVDRQVSYQIGDVRKRSTITTTMNDYMWRSPTVENDYDDRKAYKIISYYFSTPGDQIHVDGESIRREEVRTDLKSYLKYKMDKYWNSGANRVDYYLNITREDSGTKPENITVQRQDYRPEAAWSGVSYPIALSNGSATVVLWTKTSRGIYGLSD